MSGTGKEYRMILSDKEIREMIDSGRLSITPFDEGQIQPAGVDFTLGNTFGKLIASGGEMIMPGGKPGYKMITANRYLLDPGEFVLASTLEYFRFPDDLVAMIGGRSSYSRLGLFVQNTGWISPGFHGQLTIELYNAGKAAVVVESGERLGQLLFAKTGTPAESPYNGRYQGQTDVTGSMAYKDLHIRHGSQQE